MAIKISKPTISRRPDILDNGEQRLNPENDQPVWIPQVCVRMENTAAPDATVCVAIYRVRRGRNNKEELEEVCTQKKVLPAPRVGAFGSMNTLVDVCCDLEFPPEEGAEFIAAWEPAGAGVCGKVAAKADNRSPLLRVAEVLRLAMRPGEELRHSAIIGVGMAAINAKSPQVHVASALPKGWEVYLPEGQPESFPAVLAFSVASRPGAYADEVAEIQFRVVDKNGITLDEVGYRFFVVPDPEQPKVPTPGGEDGYYGSRSGRGCCG